MLSTTVLLTALMALAAFAPVSAEGTRPDQYNPLCIFFENTPISLSVDRPTLESTGDVRAEDGMLYIRGAVIAADYEFSDECDNTVAGTAYITIYSDVDRSMGEASTYLMIILDNDYGWWQGEVDVNGAWINDQLYIDVADEIPLYGAGGCWAWDIWVTLNMGDTMAMNGVMRNPFYETWCPIVPALES